MPEKKPGTNEEFLFTPRWNEPFTGLFPQLSTHFDLSFLDDVQVPVTFFPPSVVRLPLEDKFVYFIVTQSPTASHSPELQLAQALQLRKTLRDIDLRVSMINRMPGSSLIRNTSIVEIFTQFGLESILPEEFITESTSFQKTIEVLLQKLPPTNDRFDAKKSVLDLIKRDFTRTPNEILEIVLNGPLVREFSQAIGTETEDNTVITDDEVRKFITSNYPAELNRQEIQIATISGNDHFLFFDIDNWISIELTREQYLQKIAEMGVDEVYKRTLLSYVVPDNTWIEVQLFNLCQSVPEMAKKMLGSLDYLEEELSVREKLKRYALGLIAHEFLHRLQTKKLMAEYQPVAQETWNQDGKVWQGYPSEYVQFYAVEYDAKLDTILKEDMADSVQIYTINSSYLQKNYPQRFEFIQSHFPHLIPDSAR